MKDKQNPENLGEYKLQEPEYSTEYQAETEPEYFSEPPPKATNPFKKKLFIILGVVVGLFILYRFVLTGPSKSKPKPTSSTDNSSIPAIKAPQENVLASAQMTSLQQKTDTNSNSITSLQNSVAQLQTSLNELKNVVYNINNSTKNLSQNVLQLLAEKRTKEVTKKKPKVLYHVRAIVPGRAWLEGSNGLIVTVRPGTKLKEYGVVKEISSQQGIVKTSKGIVIRYGSKDI